jgi:hypothetical protein
MLDQIRPHGLVSDSKIASVYWTSSVLRHLVSTSDSGGHLIQSSCPTGGRQITLTESGANVFKQNGGKTDLDLHPTVKPIATVADAILDSTNLDDVILDPFLGSGTTLLAAERARHGVELDPLYVDDTVITRWERLTQQQARLASGQSFDDVKSERSAK